MKQLSKIPKWYAATLSDYLELVTFKIICVRKHMIPPLKVRDKYHKNAIAKGHVVVEEKYVPRIIVPLKSRWIKYGC